NIRELQNFIECSVILTSGSTLCCPLARLGSGAEVNSPGEPVTLEDLNREHICRTLQQTRGVIMGPNGAAARLGIKRTTLYARMRKLGISRSNKTSHPFTWEDAVQKFDALVAGPVDKGLSGEIKDAARSVESTQVRDLMKLLGSVKAGQGTSSSRKVA